MFYDEVIYLFLALILWGAWPDGPAPSWPLPLVFVLKDLLWVVLVWGLLSGAREALSFFQRQRLIPKLALVFFLADVALLRLPRVLHGDLWALLFYGQYLALSWLVAAPLEKRAHLAGLPPVRYLLSQLRFFLPALIPWLAALALWDLLEKAFPQAPEALLWSGILVLVALFFPALAVRLWPTRRLPPGEVRQRIETFLAREGVRVGEIYLWLPFEGRLLTAGVVGLLYPWRYLLISPALMAFLTEEELLAVVAHEVGHLKRRHLLWLLVFLFGFFVLAYRGLEPLWLAFLAFFPRPEIFLSRNLSLTPWPEILLVGFLLLLVVLYFRYFLGYFLRQFERQADLHAFESLGSARGLRQALEKVAALSRLRQAPSWHHYSLAERLQFLEEVERQPELARRHHLRLRRYLFLFLGALILLSLAPEVARHAGLQERALSNLKEGLLRRAGADPELLRAFADYLLSQGQAAEALTLYEKALEAAPEDPWILNNLAWTLLTAQEPSLRDPQRALRLAQKAASLRSTPEILDTLAEAYFQNGLAEKACQAAEEALKLSQKLPVRHPDYYRRRKEKFCHAAATP
ncbi:M48 family metalloprotease [Thermosulfurimonas marina]|uniref:M48 family metalloprotease n=1 Tax=Thermosulfurimonas marina TaxID=2047767 RepID=A0A6H1WSV1_9BACT|nr:M48 family metallopeptidase [Thermosulfurimonas marina]QJA06206.1 M48 family metalloprotease [Thermosulfurimonas marina]